MTCFKKKKNGCCSQVYYAVMPLQMMHIHIGVSENSGTSKLSILVGFSITTIHFGVPLFSETPIYLFWVG